MQTIIGRLTANASIRETKDGRQLVAFTIAQNDRFKVKGVDEVKQVTNFFNCSYWLGTGVAEHLKKGVLVEANGRIGVNAWKNMDGDARASLTLHVQNIQMHGKASKVDTNAADTAQEKSEAFPKEDAPF